MGKRENETKPIGASGESHEVLASYSTMKKVKIERKATLNDLYLVGHLGEGFLEVEAQMVLAPWIIQAPSAKVAARLWAMHNVTFGEEDIVVKSLDNIRLYSVVTPITSYAPKSKGGKKRRGTPK